MDAQSIGCSTCPFCPFFDLSSGFVLQHVQYCHPENESRLEPTKSSPQVIESMSFSGHADGSDGQLPGSLYHADNTANLEESVRTIAQYTHPPQPHVNSEDFRNKSTSSHTSRNDQMEPSSRINSKRVLNRSTERLGLSELGPYAHEKKMPSWLLRMLNKGNPTTQVNRISPDGKLSRHSIIENETPNVVPVLARLCKQDKSVQRVFLCSTHVHHISKTPREGSFCGYRNIQMLVSYMQETRDRGNDYFPGALPTILQLQDMIERAWDMGYNSVGRAETGGIKGTRKYIGTSEAQALFLSLGIQCEASSIGKTEEMPAHTALLSHIAAYFKSASPLNEVEKVVLTDLPPVYFQHHGHSMTIVGFEARDQGNANILVFDPTFQAPSVIKHATTTNIKKLDPTRILKGYRKGINYLRKYQAFELLKLYPPGIPPES
ncbi:hypothetical protein ASPVEDRAFT_46266 [Aspergillus versicolor CBS 583.65]|uniref:UFSP1/2/DUB catalytic domain-containing protein n=1 Tax=Aspergillus versicolor CBS 583.65 TaxID=1036611 RepID=A0A1L9PZG6_ASPVE|nr:uncharacterized protein ASPVEDRAFT_46266 [Aspergillus versicolor CBS 583.65]OJJ06904.1 hypothetical protein ASPVEDRAFT_46266 [Aspergillus versicolor CBS 583.65]